MSNDLWVVGSGSSPDTRTLRAALRFRRVPYRFVVVGSRVAEALQERAARSCSQVPEPS